MKLIWTAYALADRREIFSFIEADDPRAAVMVDERIENAMRRLIDYPESGRIGRVDGTRELVVVQTSYVAAYQISDDAVRILRVIHGARSWPDEMTDNS
ncbi:type II toxin-antitoxin system RelE/ParE family toxin [uncultured Parasphingorhabdus sp.]|uniref:type II toxin-antitoxin system RelE/ParE family toxin n=1 Tax=uncultured Parasphingorhabdus sp. TaxID=2709694 RepID=UPI0030DC057F